MDVEVSTSAVSPGEAFEYWRTIAYYQFEADRRPPGGLANFKAQAYALIGPQGDLCLYRSSAVTGRRTAYQVRSDEGNTFNLGIVVSGRRYHRDETDGVTIAGPGQLFCYDAAKISRIAWEDHQGLHFCLPRDLVLTSVGRSLPPASELMKKLNRSSLAPFLRSHLSLLAREYESLSLSERTAMFEATVDFLLSVLREVLAGEPSSSSPTDGYAYFVAAKRVIQERHADPNLGPEAVAHALGCSRATLYRAFRANGTTVAQHIREVRLQEAMRRIAASPPGTSISAIAAECGFYDPAYFRRLFRERFEVNPSDVLGTQFLPQV